MYFSCTHRVDWRKEETFAFNLEGGSRERESEFGSCGRATVRTTQVRVNGRAAAEEVQQEDSGAGWKKQSCVVHVVFVV